MRRRTGAGFVVPWLVVLLSLVPAAGAGALCPPGFVEAPEGVRPVAWGGGLAQARPEKEELRIRWIVHSSFLLTSPSGASVLTDPHQPPPPGLAPLAVTVSNEHETHNQVHFFPRSRVLRAFEPGGTYREVSTRVGDIQVKSIPGSAFRGGEETFISNVIFLFKVGNLCIAHLGNLRRPLSAEQLRALGKVHVLMVPIDGSWNLPLAEIPALIRKVNPNVVLPMHYWDRGRADHFLAVLDGRFPVRKSPRDTLTLSRSTLSAQPTVVILSYRSSN